MNTLIEFLDAAASTKYVTGPFEERGGIMIVGPPGTFKTTMIEAAVEPHTDALRLSDLNVSQWLKLKDEFVASKYSTLAFGEFEKVYQRHPATALNLEGIIKALVSEGYGVGPSGDPRMPRVKARSLVIGGITTDCFERRYDHWQKNGFLRRFIWIVIAVKNPEVIVEAIRKWEKIDFGKLAFRPANRSITVEIASDDSKQIEKIMQAQPGMHGTGYVLMKKIFAVLQWKYAEDGGTKKALEILRELAPSLGINGDQIILHKNSAVNPKRGDSHNAKKQSRRPVR